jgi:hypothetical protein
MMDCYDCAVQGIIIFNYGIVVYLSDPKLSRSREESSDSKLPKFVTVLGLCLIMLCLGLIPVDIYVVSDTSLSEESRNAMFDVVQILYYGTVCTTRPLPSRSSIRPQKFMHSLLECDLDGDRCFAHTSSRAACAAAAHVRMHT